MTTKKMMKALETNGYVFGRKLSDAEIKEAYETMIKDMDVQTNLIEEKEVEVMTTEERVMDTWNRVQTIKKISEKGYVTRDELRQLLDDCTGKRPGNKVTRKTMIESLEAIVKSFNVEDNNNDNEGIYNIEETPIIDDNSISVGDLDITRDNAPEPEDVIPAPENDARRKTNLLFKLIGDSVTSNITKGYGSTISAYMLCAHILEAGHGIKKLKGHEVTKEERESIIFARKWLIENGYIKTVVFKDERGFVFYTPEYDGDGKAKMWDATKYIYEGSIETVSYMITDKWFK